MLHVTKVEVITTKDERIPAIYLYDDNGYSRLLDKDKSVITNIKEIKFISGTPILKI